MQQRIDAIMAYTTEHDDDAQPFVWRKTVGEISAELGRARAAREQAPTADADGARAARLPRGARRWLRAPMRGR